MLDFLRDVGKHITVNCMVAKDSVRSRMEDRASGISFAEFSYMLLQGFDFYHLYRRYQCELQIGATDQWGNITVGTELTRKKARGDRLGPRATAADQGRRHQVRQDGHRHVWLDPAKTSPYRFYQFFLNTADDATSAAAAGLHVPVARRHRGSSTRRPRNGPRLASAQERWRER